MAERVVEAGKPVMTLPAWRGWVFSIKTFAAAVLALDLALWIDLPRPY